MDAQVDPRYITLDATGGGRVFFRSGVPGMYLQISKISVETTATGSGTVALYYKGQLVTVKAIALLMAAVGMLNLAPGEELEARFTNGPAAAQMKVTSHYVQAAAPAAEKGLSFTEAVGFAEPIDNPVSLATFTNQAINQFGTAVTPVMDVRAYNSWFGRFVIAPNAADPPTVGDLDPLLISVQYFSDPSGAANTRVFVDSFFVFPTRDAVQDLGSVLLTDQMHGPYMKISVEDYSILGRSSLLTATISGSYRAMPGPYIRVDDVRFAAHVLLDVQQNVNAATTRQVRVAPAYGPALLLVRAPSGVTVTVLLTWAGQPNFTDSITVVGGATAVIGRTNLVMPKAQLRIDVSHNSGAAQVINMQVIQSVQPY